MKKLMIGLLVAAAGTGIYFFVIKKNKEKPIDTGFNKDSSRLNNNQFELGIQKRWNGTLCSQ